MSKGSSMARSPRSWESPKAPRSPRSTRRGCACGPSSHDADRHHGTHMACPQYEDAIQEMVDGTLGPIRRSELQIHLDQCDDCGALLDDLEHIRDLAGTL